MAKQVAKVLFEDTKITERTFPAREGGSAFVMRSQAGYLLVSDKITMEFNMRVDDGADAFPVGTYLIAGDTFRTDDYGRLVVSRKGIQLIPEAKASVGAGK